MTKPALAKRRSVNLSGVRSAAPRFASTRLAAPLQTPLPASMGVIGRAFARPVAFTRAAHFPPETSWRDIVRIAFAVSAGCSVGCKCVPCRFATGQPRRCASTVAWS